MISDEICEVRSIFLSSELVAEKGTEKKTKKREKKTVPKERKKIPAKDQNLRKTAKMFPLAPL